MSERDRGLIDTSVYIDLAKIPTSALPASISISAITLAELAAGPHAAVTADERARRQVRLQDAEADFTAIPFDTAAARAYGRVYSANTTAGRSSRNRTADFLIAATAIASNLPLYTRNPADFAHLTDILEIIEV